MSELIVPPTLTALLMAFTTCFQARSWLTFQWLVLGWVQCQGRRTLTEVALASGVIGERHISVFHRFFSRASWSPDALQRCARVRARPGWDACDRMTPYITTRRTGVSADTINHP